MDRLMRWLDGVVERLCDWLNASVSGRGRLAVLGNGLAGVYGGTPLPVDRRKGPEILQMHTNSHEQASPAHLRTGVSPFESNCGFWAYCHMSGQPCVWCGGSNDLTGKGSSFSTSGTNLCPSFSGWGKSHGGSAWYGCCMDPYGRARLIAFLDCCGSHAVPCKVFGKCKNWPEAKNWCIGPITGFNRGGMPVYHTTSWFEPFTDTNYYCTVVIDANNDAACK
jgi:hypothetical protein